MLSFTVGYSTFKGLSQIYQRTGTSNYHNQLNKNSPGKRKNYVVFFGDIQCKSNYNNNPNTIISNSILNLFEHSPGCSMSNSLGL